MRPLDYVRVVRQRWWVVALCMLLGLMLAYATAPRPTAASKLSAAPSVTYQASTLLLNNNDAPSIDYDRAALYTTHGEVVDNVVAQLKSSRTHPYVKAADLRACNSSSSSSKSSGSSSSGGMANNPGKSSSTVCPNGTAAGGKAKIQKLRNGATLAIGPFGGTQVSATPDASTGSFKITVTDPDEKYAPYVANLFASELIKYYNKLGEAKYVSQLNALKARGVTLASNEAADAARAAAQPTNSALQDQVKSDSDELAKANSDLQQLQAAGPQQSALHVFEPASEDTTTRIVGAGSKRASRKQSILLGGAVGLLIGVGILILTEIMSARIRDVGGAEGAARLPVVAEIPVIKFSPTNRFAVLSADDPSSLVAEAYRALRTSMLSMWQRHPRVKTGPRMIGRGNGRSNGRGNGSSAPDEEVEGYGPRLRTLLITSPGPAEGKSITTANLAVTFAETGARVIVIDADFRRPTLHRYFHRSMTPNLGDLDRDCTAAQLEGILQETSIPGVRLAASAPTKSDPGQALTVAKAAAAVAQELADVVLLDSPPLLLANDAADLATSVDGTILLTRSGWTRRSGVVASADLLRRLDATVIGLVLIGAEHSKRGGYYGYYGYYGYGYGRGGDRGDASALKRLVPWPGGRRRGAEPVAPSRSGRAEHQGDSGAGGLATRPPGLDDDDPWV